MLKAVSFKDECVALEINSYQPSYFIKYVNHNRATCHLRFNFQTRSMYLYYEHSKFLGLLHTTTDTAKTANLELLF